MRMNHLKSWKISQNFFWISENCAEFWYKSVFPEGNFEYQHETLIFNLNLWMLLEMSISISMSLWRPRRTTNICRTLRKFSKKCKALSLNETKDFRKNDLKASRNGFSEFERNLV